MSYEFYISPADYERAKENGVSASTLEKRVRILAWPKTRAVNTPPQQRRNIGEWKKIAERNGIKMRTFYSRINTFGWDIERAATQPLQNKQEQVKRAREARRVYSPEIVELAKRNGISYRTFISRVAQSGWTMEEAATRPIMARSEASLRRGKIQKLEISRGGSPYAQTR